MTERQQQAHDLRSEGKTLEEIAAAMGLKCASSAANLLKKARLHLGGFARRAGRPPKTSSKLDAYPDVVGGLEQDGRDYSHLGAAHCTTCGLRGPHQCVDAASILPRSESSIARAEDHAPYPDQDQRSIINRNRRRGVNA